MVATAPLERASESGEIAVSPVFPAPVCAGKLSINRTTIAFSEVEGHRGNGVLPSDDRRDHELDVALIGRRLDTYFVHRVLGAGGMGRVYLAWHERLHRACALKVVAPELVARQPLRLEMFFTEARSAARLQHPNIVSVYSLGEDRGYHFIEMEFVEGASLSEQLVARGPLDPAPATQLISQVAAGLVEAHANGVVHCDVKPANVMVGRQQVAKLGDFGLARLYADGKEGALARTVGTPNFMAPELLEGAPTSAASDIYALGATYFTLLAGRAPVQGNSLAEIKQCHGADLVESLRLHLPSLPPAVEGLLREMLAKDPAARPASGPALVRRLQAIANGLADLHSVVAAAMDRDPFAWEGAEDRFLFQVCLDGGRQQLVAIEVNQPAGQPEPIVTFWTPCAPAQPEHYAQMLEINGKLPFGAVSIRAHAGKPHFVMLQNHFRSTVTPDAIRTTVANLAQWADVIEHRLTGRDVH